MLLHPLLLNVETHYIAVGEQRITQTELGALAKIEAHEHRGVGDFGRTEIEITCIKLAVGRTEDKRIGVVVTGDYFHISTTETVVLRRVRRWQSWHPW